MVSLVYHYTLMVTLIYRVNQSSPCVIAIRKPHPVVIGNREIVRGRTATAAAKVPAVKQNQRPRITFIPVIDDNNLAITAANFTITKNRTPGVDKLNAACSKLTTINHYP